MDIITPSRHMEMPILMTVRTVLRRLRQQFFTTSGRYRSMAVYLTFTHAGAAKFKRSFERRPGRQLLGCRQILLEPLAALSRLGPFAGHLACRDIQAVPEIDRADCE